MEYVLKTFPRDDCLGPESQFYQYLTDIYDTSSINIKSLRIKYDAVKLDKVRTLIKEQLIFPCLKLENIAIKAVSKSTTTNNNKTMINNYIQQLQPITDEHLSDNVQYLTIDHIMKGPEGYAHRQNTARASIGVLH